MRQLEEVPTQLASIPRVARRTIKQNAVLFFIRRATEAARIADHEAAPQHRPRAELSEDRTDTRGSRPPLDYRIRTL